LDGGAITGAFCFGEHAIKEVTDFVTGVQRDSKNRFAEISDRLYCNPTDFILSTQ
jgi:hypothetical protein